MQAAQQGGFDQQAEVDRWFRDQGLPMLVPARRRAIRLPQRTAPLVVFLTALAGVLIGLLAILARIPDDGGDAAALAVLIGGVAAVVGVPAGIALVVRRWLSRLPATTGLLAAWGLIVLAVLIWVVIGRLAFPGSSLGADLLESVLVVAATLACIWLGVGSVLGWTLKAALRNLSAVREMASVALPVITMLVIFAFFAAETWQLSDNLSWPRIFAVGLVIAVIAAAVVLPASRTALRRAQEQLTADDKRRLIAATPAAAAGTPAAAHPLSRLQRANIVLLMIVAQLLLGAIFAVLQGILLAVLGKVAVTAPTMETWLTHPAQQIVVSDYTFPVTETLLKVSVFLGLLAALSFVISAVSDGEYRQHFFDPMMHDVRRALAVHDAIQPGSAVEQPAGPAI